MVPKLVSMSSCGISESPSIPPTPENHRRTKSDGNNFSYVFPLESTKACSYGAGMFCSPIIANLLSIGSTWRGQRQTVQIQTSRKTNLVWLVLFIIRGISFLGPFLAFSGLAFCGNIFSKRNTCLENDFQKFCVCTFKSFESFRFPEMLRCVKEYFLKMSWIFPIFFKMFL